MPAISVLACLVLMQHMMQYGETITVRWWSMLLSSMIVPFAYMFFARQIGRPMINAVSVLLWIFLIDLLIPSSVVLEPGETVPIDPSIIRPLAIQRVHDGKVVSSILMGDYIVLIQVSLTVLRMIPLLITMRRLKLRFTYKTYVFGIWWATAALFLAMLSLMNLQQLATPMGSLFYFGGTSLLLCTVYLLAALRFNLMPVNENNEVIENVAQLEAEYEMIEEHHTMAQEVRRLVEKEGRYTQPGYSTKDIVAEMCTNTTTFRRMMQEEFGMAFVDYLQEVRVKKVQELLLTTDMKQDEIAVRTGFADASHMSRIFKSALNTTPGAWKRANS